MSRRRGRAYDEQVVDDAIEANGDGDDVAVVGGNSHEMVEVGGLKITHLLVHSGGVGLSLDGGATADDDVAVPADRDSLADGNGLLTGAGSDGEAEGPEGLVDPGLRGGRRGDAKYLVGVQSTDDTHDEGAADHDEGDRIAGIDHALLSHVFDR